MTNDRARLTPEEIEWSKLYDELTPEQRAIMRGTVLAYRRTIQEHWVVYVFRTLAPMIIGSEIETEEG